MRRAIDIHEGDRINEETLKALIRAAVALNRAKRAKRQDGPKRGSVRLLPTARAVPVRLQHRSS